MPLINKPQNINKIWSNSGDRATPSDQKINQGWVPEIPPHQWFNYIDNKQDQAIAHINQMGVPQWDAVTEYQANKSYAQGPTNGVVYRATQTHTNQNPEVSQGFWEVAFLTQAPDYDTTYVRLNQNLSDVPNKTQARNNLDVYSKAETNNLTVKGHIAFNGVTGAVLSSKNLTLTKTGSGSYTITIDPSARRGNANYTVVVGAIDTGVTNQGYSQSNGAHNTTTASVATRSNTSFTINCVLRRSRLQANGRGNDANDSHAMQISLADNAYISLFYTW